MPGLKLFLGKFSILPGGVIGNTPDFGSGFPGSSPGRAVCKMAFIESMP